MAVGQIPRSTERISSFSKGAANPPPFFLLQATPTVLLLFSDLLLTKVMTSVRSIVQCCLLIVTFRSSE